MKRFTLALAAILVLVGMSGVARAGRFDGPGRDFKRCNAYASVWYTETYRGGESATVVLCGDGFTDLDLFIYDQYGNLVTRAIGLTDREIVNFYVPRTAAYRIEVRNLGNSRNEYRLDTN